jgi:hypothetical protein
VEAVDNSGKVSLMAVGNPLEMETISNIKEQTNSDVNKEFSLASYPNPFNPSTTISFSIPTSEFVTLKVFDALGSEVATLVNEEKPNGIYKVDFNGSSLSSGIYFYTLQAGKFSETKKLILMK